MTSSVLIRGAQTNEGIVDVKIYDNHIIDIQPRIAAQDKDEVVDARGLILWPGLVNTHLHVAQSLLKGFPAAIDSDLAALHVRTTIIYMTSRHLMRWKMLCSKQLKRQEFASSFVGAVQQVLEHIVDLMPIE